MSTILVVDDNEQNIYLLQALLGGHGHEVVSAMNGMEAMKIADSDPPDLIISDILMPIMDGFTLCREWFANNVLRSIPFIFYTATYTDQKDADLALHLGAVRFIIKPEEPVRFMEIIKEVLEDVANSTTPVTSDPTMQEKVYLKVYNERLIQKLEKKTLALEEEIAERKLTEKQLRHAQKMEAIGTLSGGIAHDFNNILTAIIGFSEIAKAQLSPADKIRRDLDMVIKAGKRAVSLVEQILTFSRQGDEVFQTLDIQLIVIEIHALLQVSLPKTIEFKTSTTQDCGLILANPTQIHQVLMNLCTNSRQAIGEAAGTINILTSTLHVSETKSLPDCPQLALGKYLHIEVTDNGSGMDEETQRKIFDPFFTTKEKGIGTGLGLAVVHGIIKQHKGEITVSSISGQGSTFNVYLPLVESSNENETTEDRGIINDFPLPVGSEKILLVDDENDITEMTQRLLGNLGYIVTSFTSSLAALEAYTNNPDDYDLLMANMYMPEMNGVVLAREIFALDSNLPVILCTGFSESMEELQAKSFGCTIFIRKPIIKKTLAKIIRKALDCN
ncbi:MAG: hybrid sensor histidine kinase/response regulator [Desulfotalea sp.]|nr:MAG: hybrid sensor histidine kinase/response regulator [Desulfotalea sp.]